MNFTILIICAIMIYWLLCEFYEDLNYKIKEKIKDYIFILSIRKSDINIIEYIIISGEFKFNINKIQTSRYLKSISNDFIIKYIIQLKSSDFLRYENTVINIYNIRSIEEDGLICFNDGYYVISKLDIELIMGKWQSMVRERKLKELLKTI